MDIPSNSEIDFDSQRKALYFNPFIKSLKILVTNNAYADPLLIWYSVLLLFYLWDSEFVTIYPRFEFIFV